MLAGQTTGERGANKSHRDLHRSLKEHLSIELSYTRVNELRRSHHIIDNTTNPNNIACGNPIGMFCSPEAASQQQLVQQVKDAYGAEGIELSTINQSSRIVDNNSGILSPAASAKRLLD